jgi:hypothetical protein
VTFLHRAQHLVFRPGEALLCKGRPSFRERDEYQATVRAFVALQNAIQAMKPGETAKRGVRR